MRCFLASPLGDLLSPAIGAACGREITLPGSYINDICFDGGLPLSVMRVLIGLDLKIGVAGRIRGRPSALMMSSAAVEPRKMPCQS